MSLYCVAINWGDGFVTHGDREKGKISGYPGDVWVVDNNMGQWIAKVNGERKTKSEAQALVTTAVEAMQATWDDLSDDAKEESIGRPPDITLP